jgi:hypothetical protein
MASISATFEPFFRTVDLCYFLAREGAMEPQPQTKTSTASFTDLDQGSEMIILESILTTFEERIIF